MRTYLVAAVAAALVIGGCQSGGSEPGYSKDDFKKTAPPTGWRGPGEPASGPATAPSNAPKFGAPIGEPGGPGKGAAGPPPGFH